jgi:hypothetical protein
MRLFLCTLLSLFIFYSPTQANAKPHDDTHTNVIMNVPENRADYGGNVADFEKAIERADRSGRQTKVEGECDSACVLKLALKDLCIGLNASFGVHEIRVLPAGCTSYTCGKADAEAIRMYRERLPQCADRLFASRNSYASSIPTEFTAQEVVAACPQIKFCPKKRHT